MTFRNNKIVTGVRLALTGALLSALALGGCASAPADPAEREAYYESNDPIEPFNRAMFSFNKGLDKVALKPAAQAYRAALPRTLQDGIRNFLNNIRTPVMLANNVLQGDVDGARLVIARFAVNTVLGFGGFGDPAGDLGAKFRDEDFGQTLAVWGAGEGPYLMLPLFGPSNPRDLIGLIVDTLIDPINIWADNTDRTEVTLSRTLVRGIDKRSRHIKTLDDLEKSSLDFYATIRSLYRQIRKDEIHNGDAGDAIPSPSISLDNDDIISGPRAQLIH